MERTPAVQNAMSRRNISEIDDVRQRPDKIIGSEAWQVVSYQFGLNLVPLLS